MTGVLLPAHPHGAEKAKQTCGRRLVDRFAVDAATCLDFSELRQLLDSTVRDLGFDYYALLHHLGLRRPGLGLPRLDNYPEDWTREVEAHASRGGYDPVHHACRQACTGFAWDDIWRFARLDAEQIAVLRECRAFGLGPGYTVPVHVPGEPGGSCSFAVRDGRDLPYAHLLDAESVGRLAFAAARRLAGPALRPALPRLRPRERECLRLVAAGKTDWETSVILGISVETVRHYVRRARCAYDVVSRTQLVVAGLRDRWLDLDDAF